MANDLFGPVIYSYTDEQAREDGVLVAVTEKDRVTVTLFNFLSEHLVEGPPSRWPVDMMGYFRAKDGGDRALAATKGLIGTHGREARRIYEKNIGGGIWTATAVIAHDRIVSLEIPAHESALATDATIWLMPNELGGMTLMFRDDY